MYVQVAMFVNTKAIPVPFLDPLVRFFYESLNVFPNPRQSKDK